MENMHYSNIKEKLSPYLKGRDQMGELIFYHYIIKPSLHVTIMETFKTQYEDAEILKIAIHKLDLGIIIEKDDVNFKKELKKLYLEIKNEY